MIARGCLFWLSLLAGLLPAAAQQAAPLVRVPTTDSNVDEICDTEPGRSGPLNCSRQVNRTISPKDVYAPGVPPGWFVQDGHSSTVMVPAGATAINTDAYAYYVRNLSTMRAPGPSNVGEMGAGVGLFGIITCEVAGCASWAMNPTVTDSLNTDPYHETGTARRLIAAEFDVSTHGDKTIVGAVSINPSASKTRPIGADGFTVSAGPATFDAEKRTPLPGGIDGYFTHAFVSSDGAADVGMVLGTQSRVPAAGVSSQSLLLNYYAGETVRGVAGTPVERAMTIVGGNDAVTVTATGKPNGIALNLGEAGAAYVQPTTGDKATAAVTLGLRGLGAGPVRVDSPLQAQAGVAVTGPVQLLPMTTAALTAKYPCDPGRAGAMAAVTDAAAPSYNGALKGGGAVSVPVYCNGRTWTTH